MATVVSKASSGLSQTTPAPGTLLSAPSLWSSAHRVCAPPLGASHRCGDPPEPGTDSAPRWVAGGCHGCWWRRTSGGTSGSLPWGTAVQQKAGSSSPGRPLPCAPGAVTAPQPKRGSGGPGRVQGAWGGEAGFPPPTGHSRGGAEVDRRVLWAGDRVDAGADTEHQFPVSPAPPPPPGRKEASPCLSQTF